MATFISYKYVPTAPRSKSTNARPKPTSKQSNIPDKNQRAKPSSTAVGTSQLLPAARAAADDSKIDRPGVRKTGIVYGGNSKEDELDDDDRDLPTIEELQNNILQEKGVVTEDSSSDNTIRGVEVAPERGGSINHNKSASGNNSSGSPDDPIVLLGDDDSSASEAEVEVDHGSLCAESVSPHAGLFNGPKNAVDSTTPAPPNPDGWHDIDDFPETAPRSRLVEQGASTSNSIHPHASLPCLSSELLHDSTSTESFHTSRARFEATISYSAGPQSPLLRCFGASPENQLSQEGHLHTGRGVADEHGLVGPAPDIFPIDEGERKQQEVEQEQEDEDNVYMT